MLLNFFLLQRIVNKILGCLKMCVMENKVLICKQVRENDIGDYLFSLRYKPVKIRNALQNQLPF